MNVKELYDQTAQLGFETGLEDNSRFIQAANRALLQANRIRPALSVVKINHAPLTNLVSQNVGETVRKGSDDICFECLGAKAFYFESDISTESGNVIVEALSDSEWITVLDFANTNKLFSGAKMRSYRGFIKTEKDTFFSTETAIRLRFTGDYAYSVTNVALYDAVTSSKEEDIPAFGEYSRYNLAGITADFSAFCYPPIRGEEEYRFLSKNYRIEGRNTILFSRSIPGVYDVWYERKLEPIKDISESAQVDLDEDIASILPLLIASYVWLDDEPSKASYYLSLYKEQEMLIKAEEKRLNPIIIKNVNGW